MRFILIRLWRPGSGTRRQNIPVFSQRLARSGVRHYRRASNHMCDIKDSALYKYWQDLSHRSLFLDIKINKTIIQNTVECLCAPLLGAVCTLAALFSWYMEGSSAGFPAAHFVALISSARALATSRTAFIRTTWGGRASVNANTMVRAPVYLGDPGVRI